MKKRSGFTLIELMVVMAIIAILATAGLSAYTGYIKKTRDSKRISDLNAINTIVLAWSGSTGFVPGGASGSSSEIIQAIKDMNNDILPQDPLYEQPYTPSYTCFAPDSSGTMVSTHMCHYVYFLCDNGVGYALGTFFESTDNTDMYTENESGSSVVDDTLSSTEIGVSNSGYMYDIGSCKDSVFNNEWWWIE